MSEEQKIPTYDEILARVDEAVEPAPTTATAEPEKFVVSEEVQKAIAATLETIQARTFAGRHPELGKMIKCQVCGRRHRLNERKCEQKFAYLHTEEDLETGEKKDVTRELLPKSRNAVIGAAAFKGKRLKPHLNRRKLRFIEIVRELLPEEYTEADMLAARKKAARMMGMGGRKSYGTMLKPAVAGKSVGRLKFSKQAKMAP